MKNKIATVFGGTGFLGRQVVRELAKKGVIVKVATRVPERAYFLKPCGTPGQIVPLAVNYKDENSIKAAVEGSDYVVNCIGILFERGFKATFKGVHEELAHMIAKACKSAKVTRFVQISSLGIDKSTSRYAETKLAGEKAVTKANKEAVILRPSVMFGKDDDFFNKFAEMARYLPALPLIGGGKTKFQPVFVGDVADAVIAALHDPDTKGCTFELGGPDVVDFREIYQKLFAYTGRERKLVSLPFWLAKLEGMFLSLLPTPLLTPDQVESLKSDSVVSSSTLGFKDLGIRPMGMDVVLPRYLKSYRKGGRFGEAASV